MVLQSVVGLQRFTSQLPPLALAAGMKFWLALAPTSQLRWEFSIMVRLLCLLIQTKPVGILTLT